MSPAGHQEDTVSHLTCRIDGPVARVTLDRPEKLNALTLPLLDDLVATARRLRAIRQVRAVVLTGAGESFCAGLDFASALSDRKALAAGFAPRPWRGTNTFQEACYAWRRLPAPVIAVVRGNCLGGGLQLALGADFRYTTPDARWSVLEGKWGLIPDMAGMHLISGLVGQDTAKRLTMTAEVLSGTRAAEVGLATEAVADPEEAAGELIDQILTRSPDAVAAGKRLVERTWHSGARRTFLRERLEQLRLLSLPNTARARKSALTGAPPAYEHRR